MDTLQSAKYIHVVVFCMMMVSLIKKLTYLAISDIASRVIVNNLNSPALGILPTGHAFLFPPNSRQITSDMADMAKLQSYGESASNCSCFVMRY